MTTYIDPCIIRNFITFVNNDYFCMKHISIVLITLSYNSVKIFSGKILIVPVLLGHADAAHSLDTEEGIHDLLVVGEHDFKVFGG